MLFDRSAIALMNCAESRPAKRDLCNQSLNGVNGATTLSSLCQQQQICLLLNVPRPESGARQAAAGVAQKPRIRPQGCDPPKPPSQWCVLRPRPRVFRLFPSKPNKGRAQPFILIFRDKRRIKNLLNLVVCWRRFMCGARALTVNPPINPH